MFIEDKPSLWVIGKEGSALDGPEFVQKLWQKANEGFEEIASLAKKDAQGNLKGLWGAMTDFSRKFQPWEEGFSKGLYLAGTECDGSCKPPKGWTKWQLPKRTYLFAESSLYTFEQILSYMQKNEITLLGAVQDYTDPKSGISYMLFPIDPAWKERNLPPI